jgi:hypothetical protein
MFYLRDGAWLLVHQATDAWGQHCYFADGLSRGYSHQCSVPEQPRRGIPSTPTSPKESFSSWTLPEHMHGISQNAEVHGVPPWGVGGNLAGAD